jgi:enoyl-CoA hydratase
MTFQHLLVSQQGGIVTARLNRIAERNALNPVLMAELTEFARAHRTRPDIRAIVLAGGPEFFSAGADLAAFFSAGADLGASAVARSGEPLPLLELREMVMVGPDMCRAWEEIEAVTIMAIEGFCVGGACALSLCCDFRIMGAGGMMRLPEVPLGMNMSWRSLPRLTTLVGPARAKRFTFFGEAADARTLFEWGMVDEVVEAGGADAAALRWAERVAQLPPLPVRMAKEAINATANANHHSSSFMDRDQFLLTCGTADLREGMQAFFEKRKPRFEGK